MQGRSRCRVGRCDRGAGGARGGCCSGRACRCRGLHTHVSLVLVFGAAPCRARVSSHALAPPAVRPVCAVTHAHTTVLPVTAVLVADARVNCRTGGRARGGRPRGRGSDHGQRRPLLAVVLLLLQCLLAGRAHLMCDRIRICFRARVHRVARRVVCKRCSGRARKDPR